MAEWLLNRLFEKNLQKPTFARLHSLNWMRALALIVVESKDFEETTLKERYASVAQKSPNVTADNDVFESLLMSLHNLACLRSTNKHISERYNVVRSAIVAWYYCVYFASKAMTAARSGANAESDDRGSPMVRGLRT